MDYLKVSPSNSYQHVSASISTATTNTTTTPTTAQPYYAEMQRQGTNTSMGVPENGIWSTILKGVAATRMIPTKNILILGEPGVGKSTLVHNLKQFSTVEASQRLPLPSLYANSHHTTCLHSPAAPGTTREDCGLGLGYTYSDIIDNEHEIMARLGIYQLSLASPEFIPLLRFALSTETLSDACVLILLDLSKPWQLIETLQRWLAVLQRFMDDILLPKYAAPNGNSGDGKSWHHAKAVIDELKEKLELFVQSYTEPSESSVDGTDSSFTVSTTASSTIMSPNMTAVRSTANNTSTAKDSPSLFAIGQQQVMLPLSSGCLTNNLGIPLMVVCTKSDAMAGLEQTHHYKEDHFDYIQQVLRCICLKYGAALFYTSTLRPYTYHRLREYILHRTCVHSATTMKPFSFRHKAEIIEKDTVMIPSGWDSWKKIQILKERFNCEQIIDCWDEDMSCLLMGCDAQQQQYQQRQQKTNKGRNGLKILFEETIPDPESDEKRNSVEFTSATAAAVVCQDEQSFLSRYFEQLQQHQNHFGSGHATDGQYGVRNDNNIQGVVGPLSVKPLTLISTGQPQQQQLQSSHNGMHAERAVSGRKRGLTLEKLLTLNNLPSSSTKTAIVNNSYSPTSASKTPTPSPTSANTAPLSNPSSPSSPLNSNALYNGNDTPSNEVLANFFQSLLRNSSSGSHHHQQQQHHHHHYRTKGSSISRTGTTVPASTSANGLNNGAGAKNNASAENGSLSAL